MTGHRALGSSGIAVSQLSLGSFRTFERLPREVGVAIMRKARELGINFLDDARYNDETGAAPMKTGYSEVVFGEIFRASGWKREDVVIANKLWWEFWPEQSATSELEGSLKRMGTDYLDLAYAAEPPEALPLDQVVHDLGALIAAGKLRAWGVLNWPAALLAEAARVATSQRLPLPCAAQLPYSLVRRSPVEDQDMLDALGTAQASVVASFVLEGGALSGKYGVPGATGRLIGHIDDELYGPALGASRQLGVLAERCGARPAAMAIAFALLNPRVASVVCGTTSPDQLTDNVSAVNLTSVMDEKTVADLRRIGM